MKKFCNSIDRFFLGLLLNCFIVSCIPQKTFTIAYMQPKTSGMQNIISFQNKEINKPNSIVFLEYRSTFEEIYPNIDLFKHEFVTSINKLINPNEIIKSPEKIYIEEVCFGKDFKPGLFIPFPSQLAIDLSKNYCVIKITFKIIDAAERILMKGILVTATSDGHDLFFRKKRVAAAISQAEQKFADLILGKLAATEIKDITTSPSN